MRNKLLTLFFLILTGSTNLSATPRNCLDKTLPEDARQCPGGGKKVFLSRLYPAKALVVGFSNDAEHILTLEDILLLAPASLDKIVISTSDKKEEVTNVTRAIPNVTNYFFKGEYFTWVQDYFKVLTRSDGTMELFNIPYPEDDIFQMINRFSNMCGLREVNDFASLKYEKMQVSSGDYGGNIYPLTDDLVIIGDNMNPEMQKAVAEETDQETLVIETSWFETGHVDELITQFPYGKGRSEGPCDFTMGVASPVLAMNLVDIDSKKRKELLNFQYFFNETSDDYIECLEHLAMRPGSSFKDSKCNMLKNYNLEIKKTINRNLNTIQKKFKSKYGCKVEHVIEFPVLFAPMDKAQSEQFMGAVRTISPNTVNNFLIGDSAFFPQPLYDPFHEYVTKRIVELGLRPHFINATLLHDLSGGPHCNTVVVRHCR